MRATRRLTRWMFSFNSVRTTSFTWMNLGVMTGLRIELYSRVFRCSTAASLFISKSMKKLTVSLNYETVSSILPRRQGRLSIISKP